MWGGGRANNPNTAPRTFRHVHVYIHAHICIYIHSYTHIYVGYVRRGATFQTLCRAILDAHKLYIYIRTSLHIYIYIHIYTYTRCRALLTHIYCIYARTSLYIYIYIYIYVIHTYIHPRLCEKGDVQTIQTPRCALSDTYTLYIYTHIHIHIRVYIHIYILTSKVLWGGGRAHIANTAPRTFRHTCNICMYARPYIYNIYIYIYIYFIHIFAYTSKAM